MPCCGHNQFQALLRRIEIIEVTDVLFSKEQVHIELESPMTSGTGANDGHMEELFPEDWDKSEESYVDTQIYEVDI